MGLLMTLLKIIEMIFLLLLAASVFYHLFALYCVVEFFGKRDTGPANASFGPVSVLKPLKGMATEFRENLRSFCAQDYPEYEILLGFGDSGDKAIPLARELAGSCAGSDVRVIISEKDLGANRKVSNLNGLAESAKYPLLAINDSDMRVDASYLKRIVSEYESEANVGMVTSLYKISGPRSLGTALESLTIALDFIPSVLVARRTEGVTFGLGASMLVSRKSLDEIGGFPAIADYIADDYQLGNRLWKKGYKIIISGQVLETVVGQMSFGDYLTHQMRWARTYRASRPKGFIGSGITHLFPIALLFLIFQGPSALALSALGGAAVLRFATAYLLYKKVIRSRGWLRWLPLLPIKDILSAGVWAWTFTGRTVRWRGARFRILNDGRMESID
jgi:ceramide glucosyltransferase